MRPQGYPHVPPHGRLELLRFTPHNLPLGPPIRITFRSRSTEVSGGSCRRRVRGRGVAGQIDQCGAIDLQGNRPARAAGNRGDIQHSRDAEKLSNLPRRESDLTRQLSFDGEIGPANGTTRRASIVKGLRRHDEKAHLPGPLQSRSKGHSHLLNVNDPVDVSEWRLPAQLTDRARCPRRRPAASVPSRCQTTAPIAHWSDSPGDSRRITTAVTGPPPRYYDSNIRVIGGRERVHMHDAAADGIGNEDRREIANVPVTYTTCRLRSRNGCRGVVVDAYSRAWDGSSTKVLPRDNYARPDRQRKIAAGPTPSSPAMGQLSRPSWIPPVPRVVRVGVERDAPQPPSAGIRCSLRAPWLTPPARRLRPRRSLTRRPSWLLTRAGRVRDCPGQGDSISGARPI